MIRRFASMFGGGYSALPESDEQSDVNHAQSGSRDARGARSAEGVQRHERSERGERPERRDASARPERAGSSVASISDDHAGLSSPVAFYHLARSSLLRVQSWGPCDTKEAKRLLSEVRDLAEAASDLHAKPLEWQRYAASDAEFIEEMDAHWQRLPGLRERHAQQFDDTLVQPLDGPLDHYLQMQVALAEANFDRAHAAFFNEQFKHAERSDTFGLRYCERARDVLLCHRHGTEEEKLALMAVLDATGAKHGLPEGTRALVDAAAWRSRGTLPPWPPSEDAATGPATMAISTPASASAAFSTSTAPAVPDRSAAPRNSGARPTPGIARAPDMSATAGWGMRSFGPAPDFWERLAEASDILRYEGAEIDPGRQMAQVLEMLVQENPASDKSTRPDCVALLNDLHHQIVTARQASRQMAEARRTVGDLAQMLRHHPQWKDPMAAALASATRGVQDADIALKNGAPHEASAVAERTCQVAHHAARRVQMAEAGQWPNAKEQLLRRAFAAKTCAHLQGCRPTAASDRLLKRADAMLRAFDVAETSEQAATLLNHLDKALREAQAILRRAGDKQAKLFEPPKALAHA